jgi:hypothetical protein
VILEDEVLGVETIVGKKWEQPRKKVVEQMEEE